ncbi:cytochrome P450 [Streptomyces sp. NPDC050560]|uniref:cytochrome P450 n=1 Tax=Streptomyces sp. NPDC050560 TaxID=3365630 RepID=UPI0037B50D5E
MTTTSAAPRVVTDAEPIRLWENGFATDPHRYYAALRAQGPVGWGELAPGVPAYVVTERIAALDLMRDTDTFSHDPRPWESTVSEECPLLGMMRWRPNSLFSDGTDHLRYRTTLLDAFDLVEPHDLRERVHRAVHVLVGRFGPRGEADLVADFARPLVSMLFNSLFGLPDSQSGRLTQALVKVIEGGDQAAEGEAEFGGYILELIATKTEERGDDLTSRLLDHPAGLSAEEVTWQVFLTVAAGHEPSANLVSNALSRILGNPEYYTTLTSGARPVMDAVVEVLHHETPLANFGIHFARRQTEFHGTEIRPAVPIVISYGALGTFAERAATGPLHPKDASHLSWSAGPHACPVRREALLIATEAIERLTQWLPDLEPVLARDRLAWRPGPFHRSLMALPVRFTPRTPDLPAEDRT